MEVNLPRNNPFGNVPNPGRWLPGIAIAFIALSAVSTVFFTVDAEEVGVIQRFGKYVRTEDSGLHVKLPFGIETLQLVKTEHIFKEEFGFQTTRPDVHTEYADSFVESGSRSRRGQLLRFNKQVGFQGGSFLYESMMLTGDLNLATVEWTVQFRFADPYKALFKVRNVVGTIRDMSEAVMRQVVGDRTVDEVITLSRSEIQQEAKEGLQAVLDNYESGVQIKQVVLQNVNPPDEVKPSFNDVNAARQDKERAINQAWEDYNKFVPKARGDAEKQIRQAEGYALQRVNNAEGEADKFLSVWEEYKEAKVVTRSRMYLETMTDIFSRVPNKVIIDENLKGLLPLMDVNQLAGMGKNTEGGKS